MCRAELELLNWVYDQVIRGKRARGSLSVNDFGRPLLNALFDARVLHLARRGYFAQDAPGERYDVYLIDFGAYVRSRQCAGGSAGAIPFDLPAEPLGMSTLPNQSMCRCRYLRALRRAILDRESFYEANPALRQGRDDYKVLCAGVDPAPALASSQCSNAVGRRSR